MRGRLVCGTLLALVALGCGASQSSPDSARTEPQQQVARPAPSIETRSTTTRTRWPAGAWTKKQVLDEGGATISLELLERPGGAAMAGVAVLLRDASRPEVACFARSDERGRVRVPYVEPGRYEFVVRHNSLEALSVTVELEARADKTLLFSLGGSDWHEPSADFQTPPPCSPSP